MHEPDSTLLVPRSAEAHHGAPRRYLIERDDYCVNCGTCATACLYGCHERSAADARRMADAKPDCCRNCFACVLRCPRNALTMHVNPAYEDLGHAEVYTPDAILAIQDQAADGKVPVSGAGYGGPFDGSGYDNLWTDMSEIVRPTRDGIHGREHISATVHLGRRIADLCELRFDPLGQLESHIPPGREIPIPILFGPPPVPVHPQVLTSLAMAASRLGTFFTLRPQDLARCAREVKDAPSGAGVRTVEDFFNHLIIRMHPGEVSQHEEILTWASMLELDPGKNQFEAIETARTVNPQLVTIVRVAARAGADEEILRLARQGAEVIHLSADLFGRGDDGIPLLECLTTSHARLVSAGLRDQVTLLASGGLAAAEHVPKTIMLGADAVFLDGPLLAAMECTLCRRCERGEVCPNYVGLVDDTWADANGEDASAVPFYRWGATRTINLMLAWRDQLLEVLGAMGLRDVRRLRGETGRAIFADEKRQEFITRLGSGGSPTLDNPHGATHAVDIFANRDQVLPDAAQRSAPRRFPVLPGDWLVTVDRDRCVDCGICVDSCRYGVHRRADGKTSLATPVNGKCIGAVCQERNDWCCVTVCPWDAIRLEPSPLERVLGDQRWTTELLKETYRQARTGAPCEEVQRDWRGRSGGGFDSLIFVPASNTAKIRPEDVDISVNLNRRKGHDTALTIAVPWYGGGMSYGSISLPVMVGRAIAARASGTLISTGEGGYPEELVPYRDQVITQIATGLFGVSEATICRSPVVEFKYAQGAKPGLGGHLLGEKNTADVAKMRQAVPGTALFSPFPFHSVYSVEDHKKHLDWIRSIHPGVLISVKVSTPADVDMVAVGSYYAGANIVNLDGAYGGTGAAPDIAKKNIAMPLEYAIVQVHDFLVSEGIRDDIVLIAGGGIRSADDILKAIALGADGCVLGTAELVAIDCVRCCNCERGRGCPLGIATTDPELASQLTTEWVSQRIGNMHGAWAAQIRRRLAGWGLERIRDLVGRRDLLRTAGTGTEVRP